MAKWEECTTIMARRNVAAMEDITPNNNFNVAATEDIIPSNNPNVVVMEATIPNNNHNLEALVEVVLDHVVGMETPIPSNLELRAEVETEAAAQGMREARISVVVGEDLMAPLMEDLLGLSDCSLPVSHELYRDVFGVPEPDCPIRSRRSC